MVRVVCLFVCRVRVLLWVMAESSACLVRSFSTPAEATCCDVSFFFFFGFVISTFSVFFLFGWLLRNGVVLCLVFGC